MELDSNQIARLRQCADLPLEEPLEPHVVADRRQGGTVRGQCDRRDRVAIVLESNGKLRRQMLCVACASAVPEKEDLSAAPNSPAPEQTSAMAQSAELTIGVPKAIASAAGMPNDSHLLMRQKTW